MPVGFVGVADSKRRLAASGLPQIRLEGSRGGAGLVAAAVNALLRRAWLDQALQMLNPFDASSIRGIAAVKTTFIGINEAVCSSGSSIEVC